MKKTSSPNRLALRIAEEIKKRGAITFERFTEYALYDEEDGYYQNGKAEIGKKGDFYTSPAAHRAFGETLARVVSGLKNKIAPGAEEKITVLETGGASGVLAFDILDALARTDPETYGTVEYLLLDRCETGKCAVSGAHTNFRRIKSFADAGHIMGIILSNELFDAIPFHRLVFRGGKMREIFVSMGKDGFTQTEGAPSSTDLLKYFDRFGGAAEMGFAEGQRFEIRPAAAKLLKQMADTLGRGVILTIDYGFRAGELFSPDRESGTFKCVSDHKINESPYENIGHQDITAHVDFENLEKAGEVSGLATLKYTTQGQFLVDWGIMDVAAQNPDEIPAIKNLFMPGMMGDAFRVLMQAKNAPELARGFYPESPFRISFGVE
ncbi:class I SAM-dependent methyltransferase [Candidatus Mycalebacterium sp.]